MEQMNKHGCGCGSVLMEISLIMQERMDSEDLEDYKDQLEAKISVLQKKLQRINSAQKETADKE
ncbi:MAG: hypothetical protein M1113_01685 [Candidatus Thermoplasmatota archaeon]|nr:hypothetical protein [Candidatus Thermoplasmatota archaeon]